jgi:DNA polymerase (family 10)
MRNPEVAQMLFEIADLLELKGESIYRIAAYREAGRSIENLPVAIESYSSVERLMEIPGVGESIALKIHEYLTTNKCKYLEDLRKEFPAGLIEIQKVPGVGPKIAKLLYEKLGIDSLEALEKAALEHRIRKLPRMGAKSEENILRGIQMIRARTGRMLLGIALPAAEEIIKYMKQVKEVEQIEAAGSIRRMKETIGDIDILAASKGPAAVMKAFTSLPVVKEVLATGETRASILTKDNLQIDLRVVDPSSWGAALQYFTGSKAHNIKLREMAGKLNLKINEYGVFKGDKKIAGAKEDEIYSILGLQYIPPELREDQGEIEAAKQGKLPELVDHNEIKGDLHVHSKWSDGSASIQEMAMAAKQLGYEYIAICDHSKSLGVAAGLEAEEIHEQRREIMELNEKFKDFKIISGVEVNILSNGEIDFSDAELKQFELVIAGIHSGFRQPREKITSRIIAAMENEHVDIISHPTGRLIEKRAPYEVDVEKILEVAAQTETALEISASPDRLDLRDVDARKAKEYGVAISIGTDAHSIASLGLMKYGVATARRAWLQPKDVLNTLSVEELLKRFK